MKQSVISVAFKTLWKQEWEYDFIKLHFCIYLMTTLVSYQAVHPIFYNKIAPMELTLLH